MEKDLIQKQVEIIVSKYFIPKMITENIVPFLEQYKKQISMQQFWRDNTGKEIGVVMQSLDLRESETYLIRTLTDFIIQREQK